MPDSDFLTPTQRDRRIRLLESDVPSERCHAALQLCNAAAAGTDIACAVPALAAVADRPHSGDLDAMWAQHALAAAAFRGVDIRPALPALLRKLAESVNQYAISALRKWASRSLEAAAEALAQARPVLQWNRHPNARDFLKELEFLSKRLVPDAEATWKTDRLRGVRVSAGRLIWLSSHGWDLEQSIPDFIENGTPEGTLKYWTGSSRVPRGVQNRIRSWLGLGPLTETAQDRALRSIEEALAGLAAATFPTAPPDCALCSELGPRNGGSPMEGYALPAAAARLVPVSLAVDGSLHRCPRCGTFYRQEYHRDCEPFEPETDHESLTRVTFEEVRKAALKERFGSAKE